MKHYLKIIALISVFASFISCQDEENETNDDTTTALTGASPLTQQLSLVTMNETAVDNVIDSTSCFSIQLPVQVTINGEVNDVETAEDYAEIEQIIEGSATGQVNLGFVYPITVVSAEYEDMTVVSEEDFNALIQTCNPPAAQGVNCLALNYPFTISAYDAQNQQPTTETFNNDYEFFIFLLTLTATDYYEINYPITATAANGEQVSIVDNDAFQAVIGQAIADCCSNTSILTDDLIIYIPFSNETVDLTGFAVADPQGAFEYVADRDGNPNGAFSFLDGNDSNTIDVPGNISNDLMQAGAFTISLWFNRQDADPEEFAEQLMNTTDLSIFLGNQEDNTIMGPFVVGVTTPTLYDLSWIDNGLTAEIGVWHHFAFTYNGSILRIYRDGILTNAATATFTSMPGANFGLLYKGYMDDIRVYKKALTDNQIHMLHETEADVNKCL